MSELLVELLLMRTVTATATATACCILLDHSHMLYPPPPSFLAQAAQHSGHQSPPGDGAGGVFEELRDGSEAGVQGGTHLDANI